MPDLAPMLSLDIRSLVSLRVVLPIYALVVVTYIVAWGPEMALPMSGVAGLIVSSTLIGLGKSGRLHLLYGTLPVRRRTVVLAHYVVSAAALAALVGLGTVVGAATGALRGSSGIDLPSAAPATLGTALAVLAIQQPATLRWGARGATFGMLFVVFAASGLALAIPGLLDAVTAALASAAGQAWLPWGVLAVGAGSFAASYPVAVRLYERQDY